MTERHNYSPLIVCTIPLALLLSGCTTASKPQRFAMAFLPPAPKITPAVQLYEPPKFESNPFLAETPSFLYPKIQTPAQLSQADTRVRRADEHFDAGKKLYQEGNQEEAR